MLGKESAGIGYVTESGLSADTDWVVFPIDITSTQRTYLEALGSVAGVWKEAVAEIRMNQDLPCTLAHLEENESYKTYTSHMVLKQIFQEQFSATFTGVFLLRFDSKGDFWEKADITARTLDMISAFASKYRTVKHTTVSVVHRGKL